jgi:hypothetical protein
MSDAMTKVAASGREFDRLRQNKTPLPYDNRMLPKKIPCEFIILMLTGDFFRNAVEH